MNSLTKVEMVRLKPEMFIGATGTRGVNKLVILLLDEVISRLKDEEVKRINIKVHKDSTLELFVEGLRIPSLLDEGMDESTFNGRFYIEDMDISTKVMSSTFYLQAVTEYFDVAVHTRGSVYTKRFKHGKECSNSVEIEPNRTEIIGTTVKFKPDKDVFKITGIASDTVLFDSESIRLYLKHLSRLRGVVFNFEDENNETVEYTGHVVSDSLEIDLGDSVKATIQQEQDEVLKDESGSISNRVNINIVLAVTSKYDRERLITHNNFPVTRGVHFTEYHNAVVDFLESELNVTGIKEEDYVNYLSHNIATSSDKTTYTDSLSEGVLDDSIGSIICSTTTELLQALKVIGGAVYTCLLNDVKEAYLNNR